MKNSIKRAQSQACLGFAERKNFRPLAKLKKLSLTLALLITAATGAWAVNAEAKIGTTGYATLAQAISSAEDGDIIQLQSDVVLTADNVVSKGITIDFNGYIISRAENTYGGIWWKVDMTFIDSNDTGRGGMKCGYGQEEGTEAKANLCGGRYDDPVEAILTGDYASFYNIPTGYEIVNINADGSADADGFKSRVVRNYLNDTKTVATIPMPANDVTVNYTLVRDMQDQANPVTFSGLPTTGNIAVKKGSDSKYQPAAALTIQLNDALISGDDKNIIAATDLTVTVEKKGDGDTWTPGTLADFLADMQPGTYRLTATPKDETSSYEGTVTSSEFTVVEQYDLLVKPADEYSKTGLDKVTVGTEDITPDADGKASKTGIAPQTEVKLKAKRGYIIEKVETKKPLTYPIALSAVTADYLGSVVGSDGNVYPAKTAVSAGKTAVGILGKVTETGHGLILALQDATAQNWNTINGWTSVTTYVGTTLKVLPDDAARGTNLTSYTTLGETTVSNWAVAQKDDYVAIFTNLGSTTGDSDGLTYDGNVNAYITTGVGGTAISSYNYSATVKVSNFAWGFGNGAWGGNAKTDSRSVRPVLGF